MPTKTTAKQFKFFKKSCRKWLTEFGLKNWEVVCWHADNMDDLKTVSWCDAAHNARYVNICFGKLWVHDTPITDRDIDEVALHEVLEVLLFPLRHFAESRYLSDGVIDTEIHNVIQTLINVIFSKY